MSRHAVDGRTIAVSVRPGTRRILTAARCAEVVARALDAGGAPPGASLSVVLTDDSELADLNAAHLGQSGPTDVLSFPLLPPDAFPPHAGQPGAAAGPPAGPASFVLPPRARIHLGDIAVSVEGAIAQAESGRGGQTGDVRWTPADELRLLLTHGALHVCGWDHAEPVEEAAMRALERRLLGEVPA